MANKKNLKLPKILENPKVFKGVIFSGLGLILIIFFSDFLFGGEKQTPKVEVTGENFAQLEEKLEARLIQILKKIDGVGNVEVMVTIDNTSEYIFAQEEKRKSSGNEANSDGEIISSQNNYEMENSYIIVEGNSGRKQALVKTVIQPKVRGVVVVCENGNSPYIQEKVLDAVSKAFGISSARISVTN